MEFTSKDRWLIGISTVAFVLMVLFVVFTVLYTESKKTLNENATRLQSVVFRYSYDREVQKELLTHITQTMNATNIRHHIDFGSLIQLVRDDVLSEFDHDTDMSILAEDLGPFLKKTLPRLMMDTGFSVWRTEGLRPSALRDNSRVSMISLMYRENCIDISVKMWLPPLTTRTFGTSGTFWIPKDPEQYLDTIYSNFREYDSKDVGHCMLRKNFAGSLQPFPDSCYAHSH